MNIHPLFVCLALLCSHELVNDNQASSSQPSHTAAVTNSTQSTVDITKKLQVLLTAYPSSVKRITADSLYFFNGKSMSVGVRHDVSDHEYLMDHASLVDQMSEMYSPGKATHLPLPNEDPGRVRCEEFFQKMYGASEAEVRTRCTSVKWVDGTSLPISTVNHVDRHVKSVVEELKNLSVQDHAFLRSPGGSFKWRAIAGTKRRSAHSYAIAIDINVAHSHYWRNHASSEQQSVVYRNRIPQSIIDIFEKHGFIWGGKWYHFDTMHFEYRPELCEPHCSCRVKD